MTATDATSDVNIRPATLVELLKLGYKLLPLSSDHEPVGSWTQIYEDPNFWSIKRLIDNSSKFENVATVFGKSHIRDPEGRDLYLNDLDCDSEAVNKILTTPIESISDTLLRSKLQNLFSSLNVLTEKKSLLDCLREVTVVVKTRKPYGFHASWLSHNQNDHIGSNDCKSGNEFEIKTDKSLGHSTLPTSTHRNDGTFRYSHIGRKDKIEILDDLNGILLGLLKECIKPDISSAKDRGDGHSKADNYDNPSDKEAQKRHNTVTLYDLSDEIIQTTVAYFTPYYLVGHRNAFALAFSGATWYAKISEESAGRILSQIATNAKDEEIKSRLVTLLATYEKATKCESVIGGHTLADLISQISGCDSDTSSRKITVIQTLWREDILSQKKRRQQDTRNSNKVISVSETIRLIEGPMIVAGKVAGISAVQPMISKIHVECSQCNASRPIDLTSKPVWRSPIKEREKSNFCDCEESTISIKFEYITSLEILIEDKERVNNIEQLTAILFEQDTEDIQFYEAVILKGNMHVVRKYDNSSNTLQSILFVESVEKQHTEDKIINTNEDIQDFKLFAQPKREDDISLIDKLVLRTAPLTISNDLAKKALLIVAVNAGLPNDKTRLPSRIRSHAGLIGDPGLAKTQLLHQIAELVPGRRVESAQSGTPVSMTVYIDKEEKGHRMVRPGPVVFASGSILGLNEFGEMKNIEDNKYFTDSTEEGTFTVTKHGLNIPVIAHPSFIWTANPVGGRWKNPEIITEFDFPILAQWGDRMDFIIPFIEKTDEASIREYAKQRLELEKKLGSIGSTTLWLKKYLYHARSLNPYLPDSVRKILENYLVEIAKRGVRGVARKLEALERAAIGFAKLKLKDVVDEDDAYDTITLFNDMFRFYKQEVILPGHMVFLHGLNILQKSKPQKWSIDQLIEKVCSENKGDDLYIGKVKKSQYNYKIKALKPLFNKHPNVQICSRNPTVYAWIDNDSPNESGKNTNSRNNLSDITDVTDVTDEQKGNNKSKIKQDNSVDNSTSHVDEVSPASPITVNIRTSETFSSDASVTSEDSSGITGNKMNLEEPQLVLRHSSAAHILTNNDLEEVKDSTDETGSQSF